MDWNLAWLTMGVLFYIVGWLYSLKADKNVEKATKILDEAQEILAKAEAARNPKED